MIERGRESEIKGEKEGMLETCEAMATETKREKEGERECDSVANTEKRGKYRHLEKKTLPL